MGSITLLRVVTAASTREPQWVAEAHMLHAGESVPRVTSLSAAARVVLAQSWRGSLLSAGLRASREVQADEHEDDENESCDAHQVSAGHMPCIPRFDTSDRGDGGDDDRQDEPGKPSHAESLQDDRVWAVAQGPGRTFGAPVTEPHRWH